MDSQCKYGLIARGDSQIYLRLPVSQTYQEKIWDHASGELLVKEAGGIVTDVNGKPLDFSKGRTLSANSGVIATNKKIYHQVFGAVRLVLDAKQTPKENGVAHSEEQPPQVQEEKQETEQSQEETQPSEQTTEQPQQENQPKENQSSVIQV